MDNQMKTEREGIKSQASELKEWRVQTDLLVTVKGNTSAANEELMYTLELDVLTVKQYAVSERMKKLEEASGDSRGTVKESADEDWKGWGMLIY